MKLSDLLLKIKELLKSVYTDSDVHFFNISEPYNRPSFLISPIINKTKSDNYFLIDRILKIEVMCFMELEKNEKVGDETKLRLIDNLDSIFSSMSISVGDRTLTFKYQIKEINKETSIILDFKFKDDRKIIEESYENVKKVLINEREA